MPWPSEQGSVALNGQRRRALTGSGLPRTLAYPALHVAIDGIAGQVKRVAANQKRGMAGEGSLYIQASATTVMVYGTLAPVDLALNPDQDAGDHWVLLETLAPGTIVQLEVALTALKLEFVGDGIFYALGL